MACASGGQGPPFHKVQGSLASKSSEAQVKGNLPHPHPHIRNMHPLSPHQKGRTGRTEIICSASQRAWAPKQRQPRALPCLSKEAGTPRLLLGKVHIPAL